jgi:hypothetical protein
MGIQVVVYFATLLIVGAMTVFMSNPPKMRLDPIKSTASVVLIFALFSLNSNDSYASHVVYSPTVEQGEFEIELRGHTTFDSDASKDSKEKFKIDIGYGVTDYWSTAYVGEVEEDANGDLEYEATAWENIFQLTEQGEYWVDVGLYLEYEWAHEDANTDKVEGKILLEKNVGKYVNTANLIFSRHLGSAASNATDFEYAWRTKYLLSKQYEPGIEIYGEMGEVGHVSPSDQQDHRIGPVLGGIFSSDTHSKWVYEVGYLFGVSDAAPNGTFKFVIEYEFR